MANRKLPFGYQMRNGIVEAHPIESEVLQNIFTQYALGVSYSKITSELRTKGVAYLGGKCWNKNAVARILADIRYTGTDGYPPLVREELYQTVRAAIPAKTSRPKKDAACGAVQWFAVCGNCGNNVLRDPNQHGRERWQCPECKSISTMATDKKLVRETQLTLNQLVSSPEMVQCPESGVADTSNNLETMNDSFKQMLDAPTFNETAVRSAAMTLAAARLNALGSEDYETMRIQYILTRTEQSDELNIDLLRQITAAILIHPTGTVSLKLKNGQIRDRSNLA